MKMEKRIQRKICQHLFGGCLGLDPPPEEDTSSASVSLPKPMVNGYGSGWVGMSAFFEVVNRKL